MLRFFSILVVVLSVFTTFSQDEEKPVKILYHPISNEEMREGIFLNFEEFRDNNPTRLYKLNRDQKKNIERSSGKEKRGGLPVIDSYGQETHLTEGEVFAFCDGQEVYMSYGKSYFKIEDFGAAYCVFTDELDVRTMTTHVTHTPTSVGSSTNYHTTNAAPRINDYVVDMKTGEIQRLNNKLMKKEILIEYPDILEKFLNDKMKFYTIRLYITEVNIRNSED